MDASLLFLQITFFEGKCFTGRKLEVRGDCDNFQDRGFMNRYELQPLQTTNRSWF